MDTKSSNDDHPWRMGKTIDNTLAPWDGAWHHVKIRLRDLEEKGSWDNAWFNPEGKFDWSAIDRFEIVPESQPLQGIAFSFDNILVSGEEITIVTSINESAENFNFKIYPNPVTDHVQLEYSLIRSDRISITIYNLLGQKIKTIFNGQKFVGQHTVTWDALDEDGQSVGDGLYIVLLESSNGAHTSKLVVSGHER